MKESSEDVPTINNNCYGSKYDSNKRTLHLNIIASKKMRIGEERKRSLRSNEEDALIIK